MHRNMTKVAHKSIAIKHFALDGIMVIIVEGSGTTGCGTVTNLFIVHKS